MSKIKISSSVVFLVFSCLALITGLFWVRLSENTSEDKVGSSDLETHQSVTTHEVASSAEGGSNLRFSAFPQQAIVRGEKQLLIYPEVITSKRRFVSGKVFDRSPLSAVTEEISGALSVSDLSKDVFEATFDLSVVEEFLHSDAEFLPLPISNNEQVLVSVKKTHDRGEHTITLVGNTNGLDTNETFLVFHDGVMYGSVHEVYPYRMFEYAASGDGDVAIRHLDTVKEIYGTCEQTTEHVVSQSLPVPTKQDLGHPVLGGARASFNEMRVNADQSEVRAETGVSGVSQDTVVTDVIDVVMTYLQAVADELGGASATEAKIIAHVDSTTEMFINSQLGHAVFSVLGTSLETIATGGIVRPTDPADHNSLQDVLGADLSGKMRIGGGGSAWTPGGFGVYEGFEVGHAFAVSTGSSFPHEICHNLGANHSWGDGGFNNDLDDAQHYGWRFRVNGYSYRTVMSYTTNSAVSNNSVNGAGPRIGYLSDPDQFYTASYTGGEVDVALGAPRGFDGSSYEYMDPSLLNGGRSEAATFTVDNQGTVDDFSDDTFTYVSGGSITNGYNGTFSELGANNNQVVGDRITINAQNRARSSYQFFDQPLASYSSTDEVVFKSFAGGHNEVSQLDLYKDGVFVQAIEGDFSSILAENSWEVPEAGLVSGGGYQLYITTSDNEVVQSDAFSLEIIQALPVAYYKLDEQAGTALMDSSGNDYTALLLGAELGLRGALNEALEINSSSSSANKGFSVPSTVREQISSEVTIMFWAFGGDLQPSDSAVVNGADLSITLPSSSGELVWNAGGSDAISYAAQPEEYKGKWNHYAFVKNVNTGEMSVYVNGVAVTTATDKTATLTGIEELFVGSFEGSGVQSYDGLLDEFQIFNLALSPAKIAKIYSSTTVPSIYWEGQGGDKVWTTSANWSTGALPVDGDVIDISNGDAVDIPSGLEIPAEVEIELIDSSLSLANTDAFDLQNSAVLNIRGGSIQKSFLSQSGNLSLGKSAVLSTINLHSGDVQVTQGTVNNVTFINSNLNVYGGDVDLENQVRLQGALTVIGDDSTINMSFGSASAGGSFNFVFDESGISPVEVQNWYSIESAQITVDGSNYTGGVGEYALLSAGNFINEALSVTVTGFENSGLVAEVIQTTGGAGGVKIVLTPSPDNLVWTGAASDGLWETGANWNNGQAPQAGNTATINNGDSVIINSGLTIPTGLNLNLASGALSVSSDSNLPLTQGVNFVLNGGQIVKDYAAPDALGTNIGSSGVDSVMTLNSGAVQFLNGSSALNTNLYSTINVNGGDMDLESNVSVHGAVNINGSSSSIDWGGTVAESGASFNFTFGSDGVSALNVSSTLSVTNAVITVDGSSFTGSLGTYPLISAGDLLDETVNVTVTGFTGDGVSAEVVQTLGSGGGLSLVVSGPQTMTWNNSTSDGLWGTAGNWSASVIPQDGDTAIIDNGDSVSIVSGLMLPLNSNLNLVNGSIALSADANLNLQDGTELSLSGGSLTKDYTLAGASATALGVAGQNGIITMDSGGIQLTGGSDSLPTTLNAGLIIRGGDVDIQSQVLVKGAVTVSGSAATIDINSGVVESGASLNFIFADSGVTPINVNGGFDIQNATITVDGTSYTGGVGDYPLISAQNLIGTSSDIQISGFLTEGLFTSLVQDPVTNVVLLRVADNSLDSDGDGYSDEDERIMGTDPVDPRSLFKLEHNITESTLRLDWPTVEGRSYSIEYSESLVSDWKPYLENIPHTAGEPMTVYVPVISSSKKKVFYRIVVNAE